MFAPIEHKNRSEIGKEGRSAPRRHRETASITVNTGENADSVGAGANQERAEQAHARAGPQARGEPLHRVGPPQMVGAGHERLPERREEEVGVADEPRLALPYRTAGDASAREGLALRREACEAAGGEQAKARALDKIGRAHV